MELIEGRNGCAAGPVLHLRGWRDGRMRLSAICWRADPADPPALRTADETVSPTEISRRLGLSALRYDFELPAGASEYRLGEESYPVSVDLPGDLRIGFVSCNGKEDGDLDRSEADRNAMWARVSAAHREAPFGLLLQGGDQIYADELTGAHPLTAPWPDPEAEDIPAAREAEALEALRDAFHTRYLTLLTMADPAFLHARIPSLMMWDDHDICDGWGSLAPELLDSRRGRILFQAAREAALLFQFGLGEGERAEITSPELGSDPSGALGWEVHLPGLSVVAPDLRSQRRPKQVMAEDGWQAFEAAMLRARDAQAGRGRKGQGRVLVVSTVPALGPRLSWLEWAVNRTGIGESYADDLRDQWQSRKHREDWRRFLRAMLACHEGGAPVTAVSGEIHLATQGWMECPAGPMRQLVASGIAHPPPPAIWSRGLSALARLGESPLEEHPIILRPLPGRPAVYDRQRNFLTLERKGEGWSARWDLEKTGWTPELPL